MKKAIAPSDLIPAEAYAAARADKRAKVIELKKNRRLSLGPYATFIFENYETLLHQVQEMLHIERGGAEQLEDELRAYNPMVPQGQELVATVMFEITNPAQRASMLATLGGIEHKMELRIGDQIIAGQAETDLDYTSADGKASSVQFVHFPFTAGQILAFKAPGAQVMLAITHPHYQHMTMLPEAVRQELARDFS